MNEPFVVIDGILQIIERDLKKHKSLLERAKLELIGYRQAKSHEIKKKKHYKKQLGGGKFNDDSLKASMKDIAINIQHFDDKCKTSERSIKHQEEIVDTLTEQVNNQNYLLAQAELYYKEHPKERPNGNKH